MDRSVAQMAGMNAFRDNEPWVLTVPRSGGSTRHRDPALPCEGRTPPQQTNRLTLATLALVRRPGSPRNILARIANYLCIARGRFVVDYHVGSLQSS